MSKRTPGVQLPIHRLSDDNPDGAVCMRSATRSPRRYGKAASIAWRNGFVSRAWWPNVPRADRCRDCDRVPFEPVPPEHTVAVEIFTIAIGGGGWLAVPEQHEHVWLPVRMRFSDGAWHSIGLRQCTCGIYEHANRDIESAREPFDPFRSAWETRTAGARPDSEWRREYLGRFASRDER